MPLSTGQIEFKAKLSEAILNFFSEEDSEGNPYAIYPYDDDGNLRDLEIIKTEREQKVRQFSQDLATIIYDFILTGNVKIIPVQVNTGSGTGATTALGDLI